MAQNYTTACCGALQWCGAAFYNGMALWNSALLFNAMAIKQWCNKNEVALNIDEKKVNKEVKGYKYIVRYVCECCGLIMCSRVVYEFRLMLYQLCCRCKQYGHAAHSINTVQTHKETYTQAKVSM